MIVWLCVNDFKLIHTIRTGSKHCVIKLKCSFIDTIVLSLVLWFSFNLGLIWDISFVLLHCMGNLLPICDLHVSIAYIVFYIITKSMRVL